MLARIATLLLLFVCVSGQAQNLLTRPVDFTCADCPPAEALVRLSRQTGINIVFNDRFFSRCSPVSIAVKQAPFQSVLDQVSDCARISYKVMDDQVIFYRKARRFTVSGYVQDEATGERLIGASIRALPEKGVGTVSNEFGFFSLTLEEGDYRLTASYVGYIPQEVPLGLNDDHFVRFRLETRNELPAVTISDLPPGKPGVVLSRRADGQSLPLNRLQSVAMPGGEADLLRLAALQPGVQTGVDGLGGLHVRGGNADQNLILLDDVPVYNPSHALGLLSIFNPNTVSSARLWKGDFPARYGGRAASVLDVRTRDGNFREYKAGVSLGLFASSAVAEGPIKRDRSSFLVGARGTYFGPWVDFFSRKDNLLVFSGSGVAYRFYDLNLKVNQVLSDRNRLYLSVYSGGDNFNNQFDQRYVTDDGFVTDRYTLGSEWGNTIAALRWNHVLHKKLFTNSTLRFSRFFYQSRLAFNSSILHPTGKRSVLQDYGQLYQTLIRDWSGKTDFSYFPSEKLTLRWGLSYTLHDFQPGALSVNFLTPGQSASKIDSLAKLLRNNERLGADETEAYLDVEWRPARAWRFDAGLNASTFQIRNINHPSLLPRLRVQHTGARGWSQWVGYNRMSQNLHQIGSFNVSLPFELWVPSTAKVPPERVLQLTAGVGWQGARWRAQVEGYYKQLDPVLTFLSISDALFFGGAEDATGWEDRVAIGKGEARGIEFSMEKTVGSLSGFVAYTWSEATRQFPELNAGRAFPYRFDRRHDVKISIRQRFCHWLSGDATWVFATGNPITLAGVKFTHETPDNPSSRDVYVYTEVNGYRLPAYHRLDVALNANFSGRKSLHLLQLGVYNAYNRYNPFFLYVDASSGEKGKAVAYTLLPVLPVFRYEVKF